MRSHQIWGTPSVLAITELIGARWPLEVGLVVTLWGHSLPHGRDRRELSGQRQDSWGPHGNGLGCEWPKESWTTGHYRGRSNPILLRVGARRVAVDVICVVSAAFGSTIYSFNPEIQHTLNRVSGTCSQHVPMRVKYVHCTLSCPSTYPLIICIAHVLP